MSHRNGQLVRVLGMVGELLRADGVELYELAAGYGVTVRTIRRDLDALGEAGLPLERLDGSVRKRWRLLRSDRRAGARSSISASEVTALRSAVAGIAVGASPLSQPLEALLEKLQSHPDGARTAGCFEPRRRPWLVSAPAEVAWGIVTAIAQSRTCDVTYEPSRGGSSRYAVVPLRVFAADGAAYVLVHHIARNVVMTLAMHRIVQLRLGASRGDAPISFDTRSHVSSLFGAGGTGEMVQYRLRFAPGVARYITERQWHPSQRLRRGRDGSLILTFRCQQSVEVTAWVASWRQHVTVLEPTALRRELRDLGTALVRQYGRHQSA